MNPRLMRLVLEKFPYSSICTVPLVIETDSIHVDNFIGEVK